MAKVKITLKKSLIGRKENQILTCKSLALTKIGDSKVVENNPAIEGKINVIAHLVSVENAD
ncbi:MAG: 50S ribosomal protein L30 [Clostridia bacterium]|nr:50S ribosomal protein L30 [Clostridia bacterium]